MQVISREEARALGLRRYFTGEPCYKGHVTWRAVVNSTCAKCKSDNDRKYRETHVEYLAEKKSAYQKANPEICNRNRINWRKRHPDKSNEITRRYRARKRLSETSHTYSEIMDLLKTQKFKCVECKASLKKERHLDHIFPVKLGGADDISNLQWLCPSCNHRKSAKHPIAWAQENGRLL